MTDVGRALVTLGVVLVVLGLLMSLGPRLPGVSWLGRLPGDIHIERPGLRVYLPLGSCLVASVVLTLIVFLVRHVLRR